MRPTWGPPGSCRPQMGPMLAPWTLLSGALVWYPPPDIDQHHFSTSLSDTCRAQPQQQKTSSDWRRLEICSTMFISNRQYFQRWLYILRYVYSFYCSDDNCMAWKHFPYYWLFVSGIHLWAAEGGFIMFYLLDHKCHWTNGQDVGN